MRKPISKKTSVVLVVCCFIGLLISSHTAIGQIVFTGPWTRTLKPCATGGDPRDLLFCNCGFAPGGNTATGRARVGVDEDGSGTAWADTGVLFERPFTITAPTAVRLTAILNGDLILQDTPGEVKVIAAAAVRDIATGNNVPGLAISALTFPGKFSRSRTTVGTTTVLDVGRRVVVLQPGNYEVWGTLLVYAEIESGWWDDDAISDFSSDFRSFLVTITEEPPKASLVVSAGAVAIVVTGYASDTSFASGSRDSRTLQRLPNFDSKKGITSVSIPLLLTNEQGCIFFNFTHNGKKYQVKIKVNYKPDGTIEYRILDGPYPRPEPNAEVAFWTTDNEPDRVAVYEAVAARFMAENPGIEVQIVPIQEADVSQRIATAMAANQLPDIVRMGIERVAVFAAEGILDQDAAEATIASIGKSDFRVGPLAMVTDPATGKYAAIPYDGWIQAIWYRIDMFKEAELTPPVSWADINAAVDTLPGTGNLLYALTLATDPGQNYPHQVFEQVAMSNDAWPFDAEGNVTMNTPEMVEALRFYTDLQRGAMSGPQYWRGAREAYELDQAGMLFYSTYIMDDLVDGSGLAEGGKVTIPVEDLPGKTGFAAQMVGPNGSASYGQLVTLGIMKDADPIAQKVVEYFLTEGYIDVLALAPFGKVPVLKSAVDGWKELSPYFAHYSDETLNQIANGFETMQRWLFRPDYDAIERAVIGDIEGRLLIPQVISNIALEGIMTPETGAAWLQGQVEAMLAERQ